jgi:hypothetical protein
MKWLLLVPLLVSPVLGQAAIDAGHATVRYDGGRGAAWTFAGVPVVRRSSVQLHAPNWTQGYYSSSNAKLIVHPASDKKLIVTHRSVKNVEVEMTETFERVGDDRIDVTLAGTLSSDVDARLEWCLGQINAFALFGGSFVANDSDMLRMILPEPPAKRDPAAVVTNAGTIRLMSRLGRIVVKVENGPTQLALIDGRRSPDRDWAKPSPTFWLGLTGVPVKPNERFEYRVSVTFTPTRPRDVAATQAIEPATQKLAKAFVPTSRPVQIIPTPRQVKWTQGEHAVGPDTRFFVFDEDDAGRAVKILQREAKERFGWDWKISPGVAGAIPAYGINFFREKNAKPGSDDDEAYRIEVKPKTISVYASSPRGHAYAAYTLCQMIQPSADGGAGGGATIPTCEIDDSPSLAFRGVHLFTGRDSVPFYTTLVENVLARFKLNHAVLECDYTEWETDKNIWTKDSVPKSQVAQYVRVSRENGIEPIPLVQSLGHMEWMFKNGQNRDLAEDPDTPYAYAVTNEKTYAFIHGVYKEALELFRGTDYFHIGHDEVAIRGRYPYRAEAKQLGETALLLRDVERHRQFFEHDGVKMMLWGDMLLHRSESNDAAANAKSPAEAKHRRDSLPRDAVICDWHYQPAAPADYRSLKLFRDEGFTRTIACTWYNPANIYAFAEAARRYGAWGLLQTTWAGYHVTQETVDRDARQFVAYVLAAEYAWSGQSPPPQQLAWRAEEVFARAMNPRREETSPRAGVAIDHSKAANVRRAEWLAGESSGLSKLDLTERVAGVAFHDTDAAVVLDGALLPRDVTAAKRVTIKLDAPAGELAFLHATACPATGGGGAEVGAYEVAYADGSKETIPLRYGREIRAWNDVSPTPAAPDGWFGQTPNGVPVALRVLRWTNPKPKERIASITFTTTHAYASPALFGVTALTGPAR